MNAYAKIVIAVMLISLMTLFVRLINLDALSIMWAGNLIGAMALTIKIIAQKRTKSLIKFDKGKIIFLALGIFYTTNNSLFYHATKITTIANALLTHHLMPIFILIFGLSLIKEKITKISVLAMSLSLTGLGIMLSSNELTFDNTHFLGLVLGTLSAVFFALELLSMKTLTRFYEADIIVICRLLSAVILLAPFVSFGEILAIDGISLLSLLALGIIALTFAPYLHTSGLKTVKAQHAAIIGYLAPSGGILWGFLVIAEVPPYETFIGGVLILLGSYVILRYRDRQTAA